MRIVVTQKDIEKAQESTVLLRSETCPIARALSRAFKKQYVVGTTSYKDMTGLEFFPLPDKACDFVDNFDNGNPVKPFHFTI